MASVDDKKVPKEEGVRIMTECAQKRPASMLVPRPPPRKPGAGGKDAAATPKDSAAGTPGTPGAPTPRPPAPRPPPPEATAAMVLNVLASARNLKEAVCTILYDDGGAGALLGAMTKHIRNPDLAGSCLRALHYIGASPTLVGRMVGDLKVRPAPAAPPALVPPAHLPSPAPRSSSTTSSSSCAPLTTGPTCCGGARASWGSSSAPSRARARPTAATSSPSLCATACWRRVPRRCGGAAR